MIITKTPANTSNIPIIFDIEIDSPNNKMPKTVAVNGSSAPRIAVFVEPINFIAIVIVSNEIIVGIIAIHIAKSYSLGVLKICKFVQNFVFTT